ncbi:hypothetical protein [Kitasatospora sp. NPDC004272]
MADLGPERRARVIEQSAAAGVPVERFLRRSAPEPAAGRLVFDPHPTATGTPGPY